VKFDPYEVTLLTAGVVGLIAAVVHRSVRSWPFSLALVLTTIGAAVFASVPALRIPDLRTNLELTEKLTEAGVLLSLTVAGLAIDRPLGWKSWMPTWRLLAITMPLCIAATAIVGSSVLGLSLASAVLLGAVLAPTDPVVADELTIEGPVDEDDPHDDSDVARSTLTSEAGLNDALAFPFVYLAVAINDNGTGWGSMLEWFGRDVLVRLTVGVAVGLLVGRGVAWLSFRHPREHVRLSTTAQGFVALASMLVAYGAAELAYGYGFLAVFIAAVVFRREERDHEYHRVLHDFTAQLERVAVVGLLLVLGGAFLGGILSASSSVTVASAVLFVVVVRPVCGFIGLAGMRLSRVHRQTMAVFGIRGIGSIYYLSYALRTSDFTDVDVLWATVAATVIASIVIHGTGATLARRRLDR